jgi:6,7-dimethyl-8-ribityllumazine synthase
MVNELRATIDGHGLRVAVVVARFNPEVTDRLRQGALDACRDAGVAGSDITVVHVPGAFELPGVCKWLAAAGRHDAIVALGAVVKGDTDHYEYVCRAATDGVLRACLDTGVPIGFGVLTCAEMDQAMARAGGAEGNKGADAALAALEMAALRRLLTQAPAKAPPPR